MLAISLSRKSNFAFTLALRNGPSVILPGHGSVMVLSRPSSPLTPGPSSVSIFALNSGSIEAEADAEAVTLPFTGPSALPESVASLRLVIFPARHSKPAPMVPTALAPNVYLPLTLADALRSAFASGVMMIGGTALTVTAPSRTFGMAFGSLNSFFPVPVTSAVTFDSRVPLTRQRKYLSSGFGALVQEKFQSTSALTSRVARAVVATLPCMLTGPSVNLMATSELSVGALISALVRA